MGSLGLARYSATAFHAVDLSNAHGMVRRVPAKARQSVGAKFIAWALIFRAAP